LDVISTSLSKNFVVPGLKGKMIGEEFLIQLTKLGILDEDNKPIYVVMNDTPAVLLSCPEAKIGGVVASGFNFAVEIAGRVYNMEAGGFDKVPFHDASEAIDLISENPDKYLAEKQISGIFLGEQFKLIVRALERDGLIISRLKPDITSALINQVLQLDEINMEKIGNLINEPIDSYDLAILQMIANTLRKRSAQIVGTMIGAIISTLKHEIPGKKIQIPIEGPVFWNIPLYRQIVAETANDISGCDIEFIQREHAGIVGAAIAVLARLNQ
jgi:hexokinase